MSPRIYPAIDIINGQCVRLTKGDFSTSKVYSDNPVELACYFQNSGAEYLHIVDLDGAKNPYNNNHKLMAEIISGTTLKVQAGGGIRNEEDIKSLLDLGVERVILGSVAISDRKKVFDWLNQFGSERIVIGADVSDHKIAIHGWQKISDKNIFEFIELYRAHGAVQFLCTDIARDGMLSGSSHALYNEILTQFDDIGLIASGGVHDMNEVALLQSMPLESIIIGKAIYEGKIDIRTLLHK
jgi:phosphoribosylformimino-5-aminoimidazole carboxamide ribotide isomerase